MGLEGVRQDHADLNPLRAPRTHQENTLSYSRRQEMGLAVVEQYSIKQTSVLFQSHTCQGLENTGLQPPQRPAFPRTGTEATSLRLCLFLFRSLLFPIS